MPARQCSVQLHRAVPAQGPLFISRSPALQEERLHRTAFALLAVFLAAFLNYAGPD
jgi:hypothetical protein